jgi:hypothetical protein
LEGLVNIFEAQQLKARLEVVIREKLNEFQTETGLAIDDLNIERRELRLSEDPCGPRPVAYVYLNARVP